MGFAYLARDRLSDALSSSPLLTLDAMPISLSNCLDESVRRRERDRRRERVRRRERLRRRERDFLRDLLLRVLRLLRDRRLDHLSVRAQGLGQVLERPAVARDRLQRQVPVRAQRL